jgi:Flp pilus assembly pilin Flp
MNHPFHADFMCDMKQSRESTDLAQASVGFMKRTERNRRSTAWTWNWTRAVRSFVSDETGQDLIEYALLAGSIGLVGIAMWNGIVTGIGNGYQGWDTNTQNAWQPQNPTP